MIRDLTISFSAFNIKSVPRSKNFDADILANTAYRLIPPEGLFPENFSIELMYMPSILDNVRNWKVFDDDQQILDFLSTQDTFQGMEINEAGHDKSLSDLSNIIPKSVINIEKFYDLQDKFKQTTNCKTQSSSLNYELVNLGTEQNPRFINLGVDCSDE